jgi:hypothetical protein
VALHSQELDTALKARAEGISDEIKGSYTGNKSFLCTAMDVPIPFLPVDGEDEYKLFTRLMLDEMTRFDADKMALKWIDYVDGKTVFPKLPAQLRQYRTKWERNRRVQKAVKGMKSDLEILEALNKEQVPADLLPAQEQNQTDGSVMNIDDDESVVDSQPVPNGLLCFPSAAMPPAMQQPTLQARRPNSGLPIYVGLENIGETVFPFELPPLKRSRGQRGKDQRPRKKRSCKRCVEFGGRNASTCVGRGAAGQTRCMYFNVNGTSK